MSVDIVKESLNARYRSSSFTKQYNRFISSNRRPVIKKNQRGGKFLRLFRDVLQIKSKTTGSTSPAISQDREKSYNMIDIARHRPIRKFLSTEKPNVSNAAVYARYSSDLQDKTSIDGQFRKAREWAAANGLEIEENCSFADEAISGTKDSRPGLERMLEAAEKGLFQVLIVESLSRLARSHVYASTVMMQLVYVLKIRIVGIDDGCDTNNPGWELLAGIKNILNEQYIRDLGKMVYRGQVENLMQGFSIGDLCFGYDSRPVSGEDRNLGRVRKLKMRYVVNEEQAAWVRKIFHWFVRERKSIRWIAKELTRLGAPKDRRSSTRIWHSASVRRVLLNTKYIGIWPWGERRAERNPINGKVRYVKRTTEEISKYTRLFPELRLISDDLFNQAGSLLQASVDDFGKKGNSSEKNKPAKHLLSHLIRCGQCGGTYRADGVKSQYMYCRNRRFHDSCDNGSLLKRPLAERLILSTLKSGTLESEHWLDAIEQSARDYVRNTSSRTNEKLEIKTKEIEDLHQKIECLLDCIENGNTHPDIARRLIRRRDELTQREKELYSLQAENLTMVSVPSRLWIKEKLSCFFESFACGEPNDNIVLARLLEGPIIVSPVYLAGKIRPYLRGVLRIHSGRFVSALLNIEPEISIPGITKILTVDFRDTFLRDEQRRMAIRLFEEGRSIDRIGKELELSAAFVSRLIKEEFLQRGEALPDFRKRRTEKPSSDPVFLF